MTGFDPHPTPGAPFDAWNFREDVAVELAGEKLSGDKVEAVDGSLGKVADASSRPGDSYLIVTTGRLFGRRVMVPAGSVNHIDHTDHKIYLDRSRDEVKAAPEIPPDRYEDPASRDQVASYYRGSHGQRGPG